MNNYLRESGEQTLNFKGKKLKSSQPYQFAITLPGICFLTAEAVLMSNKFTNNPYGILTLISMGCDSSKVKHI
jgi:hypothetical protein